MSEKDALPDDSRPLLGKRLALFRAEEQLDASLSLIRARGGVPISVPLLEIHSLAESEGVTRALSALAPEDWLFFTSPNGVVHAWPALTRVVSRSVNLTQKVAAVGPATARELSERGCRVDFVPTKHNGEGLALEWCRQNEAPRRILLLRAQSAGDELPRILRAAGNLVTDVAVYETRVNAQLDSESLRDVDALLFTSPSTVRGYLALHKARRSGAGGKTPLVASIGPVTSRALMEAGMTVDVMPTSSTFEALLSAVEAAFVVQRN